MEVELVDVFEEHELPRRSLRLALTELNEMEDSSDSSPNKTTSPEEMLIAQRGPRRKPLTWSPFDYDRTKTCVPSRDKTPEPVSRKCEMHPRLRRRLVLSPSKEPRQELSIIITKKLKTLQNLKTSC